MMRDCRLALLVGMMLLSATVSAQVNPADSVHHIGEVQVVSSQQQQTLTSTAPLHVMDHGEMLRLGVIDIADALHRLPGITLRDYGGAGGMKTVAVRGFGAKHIGVSYDGVMLSECQSGEIDLSRYSLDNVGALSLVIGDNDDIFIPARQASTPATLHIETLRMPTDDLLPHLTTQVKVGSFGYVSPFVRYEQNASERFAFSAVGEYTYAENDYPFKLTNVTLVTSEHRTNSRMNSGHGELNFAWRMNNASRLTGKVYYYDNDRQLPGQVKYYTNLSGESLRDRNVFGQLLYQTHWADKFSLKWYAKYNWAMSDYKDRLIAGGANDATYWQREAYTSAALLYTPDNHWSFDYSLDYAFNNLNGSSWRSVVGRPYRHTVLQSATAKYHEGRLTVMGRLLYSLYLNEQRETDEMQRQDTQVNSARNMRRLSPSFSVAYQLLADADLYVRLSYKNIFRSPTFNESYYFHYGSTDLKPESTNQWNVGLTYGMPLTAQGSLHLTLDGYYNHVKDMIVSVPHNMFVWHCVNLDKVRSYGLDATMRGEYSFSPKHVVLVAGNYSFQRVENRNNPDAYTYGYQVAYMPKHMGSLTLSYENPWVNLSLHGTAVSSRWPNNEHYEGTMIDGYKDFGVTLWRQFRWGRHVLEGRLDVKNVFDEQYEIVARYPMPGRSYLFTLKIKN